MAEEMNWYVLYTKPKWEKKTALQLENIGFEVYCPLITQIRQWSDRKKKVQTPLFNSYIFVRLKDSQRSRVFDALGAVRYLFWLGKPAIVKDHEIEIIRQWLEGDAYEEVKVCEFQPGDEIEIRKGVLKGKKAIVREVGKREIRLILPTMGFVVTTKIKEVI